VLIVYYDYAFILSIHIPDPDYLFIHGKGDGGETIREANFWWKPTSRCLAFLQYNKHVLNLRRFMLVLISPFS
jgi:hypothetical protein